MRFPQGKCKALTFSYDDGVRADQKLIALFRKYGLKGTFNLGSHIFDIAGEWNDHLSEDETYATYRDCGQEIAMHGATHVFPDKISLPEAIREFVVNREYLEQKFARPVTGLAYAYGAYTDELVDFLRAFGVKYARTTASSHNFSIPKDWLRLSPTCHHNEPCFYTLADEFFTTSPLNERKARESYLFYVWGHSYEFDRESGMDSWSAIEAFCARAAEYKNDVWFATNGEVYDYVRAYERLEFTCNGEMVYNPSAIPVWVEVRGKTYKIDPNQTVTFDACSRKL